ncbi:MAG: TMEM175 family protein [Chitinophagaceae bacterium]
MKIGTTRVETFSDGVIAIIITIMVLALKLPDIEKVDTSQEIRYHLLHLLPYLGAYAFSFMMIGMFWTNHHHLFHLLEKTDSVLLWQNLLFLFWMSLIPLSTALIGANVLLSISVAVYGFVMLMTTLSFAIMRTYTLKKALVHRDSDKMLSKAIKIVSVKARTKSYIGTLAYLCSVPLAYVNVYYSFICFIIPPIIFFIPDGIDDEKLAQKVDEKNS